MGDGELLFIAERIGSKEDGRQEERRRCVEIVRRLQAECNPKDDEEVFAINRLARAISEIERG